MCSTCLRIVSSMCRYHDWVRLVTMTERLGPLVKEARLESKTDEGPGTLGRHVGGKGGMVTADEAIIMMPISRKPET